MPEEPENRAQDIAEIWREWLTQSERQFNAFFNEAMDTEAFARSMGGYMEMMTAFQRMVTEGMQRYLTFVNMPSRTDVMGLGETLRSIEARLARIEEMLQIAAEVVEASERPSPPASEPFRTRRPPGLAFEERVEAVPEELRR
jgi:hypothetical protein